MPRKSVLTGPIVLALVIGALAWATAALGTSVAGDGTSSRRSAADRLGRAATAVEPDGAVARAPLGSPVAVPPAPGATGAAVAAVPAAGVAPGVAGTVEGVAAGTPVPTPEPE